MAFWFIALGAVLGGILGQFGGALCGALLGWLAHRLMQSSSSGGLGGLFRGPAKGGDPTEQHAQRELMRRVAVLEDEVRALKTEVVRLKPVSEPVPVPEPAMPVAAPSPPLAMSLQPTPVVSQAPLQAEVPMKPAVVRPEPAAQPGAASEWPDDTAYRPAKPRHRASPPAAPKTFKDYIPERLRPFIFGGNTIVKVGVLILFLGLAFLLSYVAEQVTVSIEQRYAGVALLGVGLLGLGWRLRHRGDAQGDSGYGLILQGAGVGVFYLTTLAAMKLHPLLPVGAGFAIMVLVTVLGSVLAVAQNAPWLAYVAAAAGFATPVLVSTGQGNHIALFSYLAILDLGIVAIAWFKAWRPLNLIGFVGTFTLAAAWARDHYRVEVYDSTQAFLLLFFLMFTVISVLFARRALALGSLPDDGRPLAHRAMEALRQVGRVDSTLVFGVPLAVYGLQYQMVQHDPWLPALSALGLGLFYVMLGGALWRGSQARYALLGEAYVVVGVLLGTLSIPLALEGVWTGATWAVEAAGMYWLGTRQHRSYTRAFALALLAAAASRTLGSLVWVADPALPLIHGSRLGEGMLAVSALAVALVHRAATRGEVGMDQPRWEATAIQLVWCLAVLAVAVLPWMIGLPTWASVSMALMAVACLVLARALATPVLQVGTLALHAVSIIGFASTLHRRDDQAMLASGLEGLSAAWLIGGSFLASAWLNLRDTWRQARDRALHAPPPWSLGSSLALFFGVLLISGALLFMMPLDSALLAWPFIGLLALWVGLRIAHPMLCWLWGLLNVAAVAAFLAVGPLVWPVPSLTPSAALGSFGILGGLAWWTPLVLSVTALVSGAWLHAAARPARPWRMAWTTSPLVQAGVVVYALSAWSQTLPPEVWRHLQAMQSTAWWPALLALWVTLTSAGMAALARRFDWHKMGQATALSVSAWAVVAWQSFMTLNSPPLSDLGWLAWPLACCWHVALLKRVPAWWSQAAQRWMHVGGFWLFAALATWQGQWLTDQWASPDSAWQALGWVMVPMGLVVAVARSPWRARWPLRDFQASYHVAACLPLVSGLVLWLLSSLFHAGDAAPLPYVPVLNPLELGQGLVLLALTLWMQGLPSSQDAVWPAGSSRVLLGGLAFTLLTTMVLRACHHWAGVPWEGSALFDSKLTQAALSVTWALVGVALMLRGHRQIQRAVWLAGAGLLGVVVVKLFFVELADRGGLYRIVSFIAVGLMLLVVGYFAPVPPERKGLDEPAPPEGAAP